MPKLTRRDFLKAGGAAAAAGATAVALRGRTQTLDEVHAAVPEYQLGKEKQVPTVCSMCPSGCGMVARVVDGRVVKLEGNPLHPINQGALCPKGQGALELVYNPDRVQVPLKRVGERGQNQWEPINWATAIEIVAERLKDLRQKGTPERTVFMYGEVRGQMRQVIERFMSAIGSPNAISHDSLNIQAAKTAHLLTQGIYDLMAYDLENSAYILSFGASLLEAGRPTQRFVSGISFVRRGRPVRSKVVVVDPRQGVSGAKADEWIPIRPGTDGALALGMAYVIISSGLYDKDFVDNYGFGFSDFKDEDGRQHQGFKSYVMANYDPKKVEKICGLPSGTVARLAGEFATNRPAVAIVPCKGGLLNGNVNGLYTAMAIHTLNGLVGNIEKEGGILVQRYPKCPGWPALPDDPVAERGRQAERVDGAGSLYPLAHHAYQAVADRILANKPYPVEALFLYDANPVYECPGGQRFIEAFKKVPFIVSFSSFIDESAQYADLILPDHTFLERFQDDFVEGIGYPGIALRQPVINPIFRTLNTGDALIRIAQIIGGPVGTAFPWKDFEDLLKFRLSEVGTTWEGLKQVGVWAVPPYAFSPRGSKSWQAEVVGKDRQRAPRDGRFDFFSRELWCLLKDADEARLKELGIKARGDEVFLPHFESATAEVREGEYPFLLNVYTSMSLGSYSANANLPSLQEISGMTVGLTWDSWVEINPERAHELGIKDNDEVWIESPYGKVKTRAKLVKGTHPDVVNVPYNQGHKAVGHWAKNRGINGLELMSSVTEPLTGLASFTRTRVKVYK